jgi:hypothetical protein
MLTMTRKSPTSMPPPGEGQTETATLASRRAFIQECDELRGADAADAATFVEEEQRLRTELAQLVQSRHARASARESRIDVLRRQLETTASPAIATFIARLRQDDRQTAGQVQEVRARRPGETAWTNFPQVRARRDAIARAIAAAEGFRYEPLKPADVEARLQGLWNGLPEVEQR